MRSCRRKSTRCGPRLHSGAPRGLRMSAVSSRIQNRRHSSSIFFGHGAARRDTERTKSEWRDRGKVDRGRERICGNDGARVSTPVTISPSPSVPSRCRSVARNTNGHHSVAVGGIDRGVAQRLTEPQVGIEPTTARLRIECSTTELLWHAGSRSGILQVGSALARTRTATPFGTTPSRWRVYQFHHQGASLSLSAGVTGHASRENSRDRRRK